MKNLIIKGCKYEGETNPQGLWHGQGKVTYVDGSSYDGQWVEGQRQGRGVLNLRNGDVYTGFFDRDELHGSGEYKNADGSAISTTWNLGRKEGEGVLTDTRG